MPEAAPSMEALPRVKLSTSDQETMAAAVARKVFMVARTAPPDASRLEPALKPNQPNHSMAAPTSVSVMECGAIMSLPKPVRLPTMIAPIRPATPALM
ncbi:hypothetical protein D3C86_1444630 [compost metagenome]